MDSVEDDSWGLTYRVLAKRIGGKPAGMEAAGRELPIVKGIFLAATSPDWSNMPLWADAGSPVVSFTREELMAVARRMQTWKDPGPDGLINEVLAAVASLNPFPLLITLNACLSAGVFSRSWKTARVILLYKGAVKPIEEPRFYRPISLLDGAGKMLEQLLLVSGQMAVNLAPNQYEFRPGLGTMEAMEAVLDVVVEAAKRMVQGRHLCVLVTLDVKKCL